MTTVRKTLALAVVASMMSMGVAMAQTDPTPPAAGDTMAAPAASGDAMPMKKPMKHMTKKKKMKKKMMKKM